ncbi:protein CHUP1, chloroplastic [Senna tora]|uniref:Protein CHUP1, chloroplastic n=1 Tax=Senna tora TaxID=362788 RepID=A0A834WLN1_9FABA|nr:protein CHUP1, chloroplastic [Senna tora]
MIVRLGLLVVASIAAYTVKLLTARRSKSSAPPSENGEARDEKHQDTGPEEVHGTCSTYCLNKSEREEEEEEEEVKFISSMINQVRDAKYEILPEYENLHTDKAEKDDKLHEIEMAKNANELERLREVVKEMEEREMRLEGELLEYYGLKEQESDVLELQKKLKIKMVEIDMLNITINSLEAERKKLQEELAKAASTKKELEASRSKIKELQRQIQLEANQTKDHLLLLKQQVSGLQAKEEEAMRKDAEIEKKLKAVDELEVEIVELKRKNKELQHEKRELTIKLDASQSRITALSNMTESDKVAKAKEEVSSLRRANENLLKQVEGLQMNRFSEVEELVYLRWVNACLRYELKNHQTPTGKLSARDLNKSMSPRSQEKAKQLMLEYAGSDLDSNFSHPSPQSEDFENASIDSFTSKYSSNLSKKGSLIQKMKKLGKSKDDPPSSLSSPAVSLSGDSSRGMIRTHRHRVSLETLMLRNAEDDSVAITTFGQREQEPTDFSLNSVAASFQLMSKSVYESLDEKYPAYKDLHKLALTREKHIKEKAEQARVMKFRDGSNLSLAKAERERPISLPPKLAQIKEKAFASGSPSDQSEDNHNIENRTISKMKLDHTEKRPTRVPRPPPKASGVTPVSTNLNPPNGVSSAPSIPPPPPPPGGAPPPPPPPGSLPKGAKGDDKVHRAPELVEFYQALMKRETKKDTSSSISSTPKASDARSNMIGEIENRSSFLLAVKADVETQGDFVMSLATDVRAASFSNIDDLVAFVNWLDEELSFLVDERAVLKHFDWPEGKADALREAAFEYQDLMKLEKQVSTFIDDPKLPCEAALKKMYSLLEKMEQSVYSLLRTRDMAISRYREFGIPINWLSDSGVVGKIKISSVQLAKKYMKRVVSELEILSGPEKEPMREFLVLQGVRFAFRVHQFAGGFDAESMKAFEILRSRIHAQAGEDNKPQT